MSVSTISDCYRFSSKNKVSESIIFKNFKQNKNAIRSMLKVCQLNTFTHTNTIYAI